MLLTKQRRERLGPCADDIIGRIEDCRQNQVGGGGRKWLRLYPSEAERMLEQLGDGDIKGAIETLEGSTR